MRSKSNHRGSAIVIVLVLVLFGTLMSAAFLSGTLSHLKLMGLGYDAVTSRYQMESAYQLARSKLTRGVSGIILEGKIPTARSLRGESPALTNETYNNIVSTYTDRELEFLKDAIVAKSVIGNALNTAHEFHDFDAAFPSNWAVPANSDNPYIQVKYSFTPSKIYAYASPSPFIRFEYEYLLQVRAYGETNFTTTSSEDSGRIEIILRPTPFSQWALFRSQTTNPAGSTLYFAGGDTSSQIQEIFFGPVHTNTTPNFYGHPKFKEVFSSAVPYASWNKVTGSGYSGEPSFDQGYVSGSAYSTTMPTQIYSTTRLAAGDPASVSTSNDNPMTNTEVRNFLAHYAGGDLSAGSTAPPNGIYLPINDQSLKVPTGGIYVQGDAQITMNVVQGSSDFNSGQWSNITTADRACKYQKISINSLSAGVAPKDVYISASPCDVTYVFDASNPSSTPVVLNGRINGSVHVNGTLDQFGGASRTRPAIAQDFAMTVSATKTVKISNDLQYEDVNYVTLDTSGNLGSTTVATPLGAVGGSGLDPTSQNIAAQIPSTSQTVLGIISMQNSVVVHSSAPNNINIHAAIYAGNSAALSGGVGCGSGSNSGCGFGVENYSNGVNKGSIKLFGGISEYRSQGVGVLTPASGYSRRYMYDSRLRQDLMPPAFPISSQLQAYPQVMPYKTWRISSNP